MKKIIINILLLLTITTNLFGTPPDRFTIKFNVFSEYYGFINGDYDTYLTVYDDLGNSLWKNEYIAPHECTNDQK